MSSGENFDSGEAQSPPPTLTLELRHELWARILERLNTGEVLITQRDFQAAFEQDYQVLTGINPSPETLQAIGRMVAAVNDTHPETYLAQGVQNSVNRAFETGVRKLKWDTAKIQARGVPAIHRFRKQDKIRKLFHEMNIEALEIDIIACVQQAVKATVAQPPVLPAHPAPLPQPEDSPYEVAVEKGVIDREDVEHHLLQQQRVQARLEDAELAKVPDNLTSYVARGLLTQDEAETIAALHQVDLQEKQGQIEKREASEYRDRIMPAVDREQLNAKIRNATTENVNYLQVFESLQKIAPRFDHALRLLIRHKYMVVTEKADDGRNPLIQHLIGDKNLLNDLVDIMVRKDPEIRLLDVRLPPYNAILQRSLEKIDNLTIEEEFVDELRTLSGDGMSERLNSLDAELRVRPAADMRCFINLIDHVVKRTHFRKKIRMLRVAQSLEEFNQNIEDIFRATSDAQRARKQAEQFINRGLRHFLSELAPDEVEEIKQRTAAALSAAEQAVQSEALLEAEILQGAESVLDAEPPQAEPLPNPKPALREESYKVNSPPPPEPLQSDDDLNLSSEEIGRGIQIGRVEMRIAGRNKRIPQKIMPDPDNPGKFCIAQRDPETGDLIPQMRRGARRHVMKGRGGGWLLEKQ